MSRVYPSMFLMVIAAPGCMQSVENQSTRPPPGEIDSDHTASRQKTLNRDFGRIRPGSLQEHQFQIQNHTPTVWNVTKVETACSCTVAEIFPKSVEPGATLNVSTKLRTPKGFGDIEKPIRIHFRDSEKLNLTLAGQIRPFLVARPERLVIDLDAGKSSASFELLSFADKPVESVSITSSHPQITCTILKHNPDQARWEVSVQLGSVPGQERIQDWALTSELKIEMQPNGHVLTVPVIIQQSPPLRILPRIAHFGMVRLDSETTKTFSVLQRGDVRITTTTTSFSTDQVAEGTELNAVMRENVETHRHNLDINLHVGKGEEFGSILQANVHLKGESSEGEFTCIVPVIARVDSEHKRDLGYEPSRGVLE